MEKYKHAIETETSEADSQIATSKAMLEQKKVEVI